MEAKEHAQCIPASQRKGRSGPVMKAIMHDIYDMVPDPDTQMSIEKMY